MLKLTVSQIEDAASNRELWKRKQPPHSFDHYYYYYFDIFNNFLINFPLMVFKIF